MSLRHKSREYALQMLFEWDMTRQEPKRVEQLFWKSAPASESTREFANQLFEGAVARAEASDQLIEKLAENWRLERLRGRRPQHPSAGHFANFAPARRRRKW